MLIYKMTLNQLVIFIHVLSQFFKQIKQRWIS